METIEYQIKQMEQSISCIPKMFELLESVLQDRKKKVIETEKAIENAKSFKLVLEEELIQLRKRLYK